MLVLTRKVNQSIIIDGHIEIQITKIDGDIVKMGIEAPRSVTIHRKEVFDNIHQSNREAASNYRIGSTNSLLVSLNKKESANKNNS